MKDDGNVTGRETGGGGTTFTLALGWATVWAAGRFDMRRAGREGRA